MGFKFFKNQMSLPLRSIALGTFLAFAGVLFVNSSSNECKVVSMKTAQEFGPNKVDIVKQKIKEVIQPKKILRNWINFILLFCVFSLLLLLAQCFTGH